MIKHVGFVKQKAEKKDIGLIIITELFHVVAVRHGFTRMIDILICIIVLIAEQRWKKAKVKNE